MRLNQQIKNLIWDPMPDCNLKRIYVEQDADILIRDDWSKQFEWLNQNLESMYTFFQPKLKDAGIQV